MCQSMTQMSSSSSSTSLTGDLLFGLFITRIKDRSSGKDFHVLSSDSNLCAGWCICRANTDGVKLCFLLDLVLCFVFQSQVICFVGQDGM